MAFRRSTRRRSFGSHRRGPSVRSPKNMHSGWVASVNNTAVDSQLDVVTNTWFTDVLFFPLVEVADYADHESLDPDGTNTKQERCRVLKMHGNVSFIMAAGVGGGGATWHLAWYIARFGKEETDNAVANGPGGGLVNYDPLSETGSYLFRQQAVVEHRFTVGQALPVVLDLTPDQLGIRNYQFNKRMGLPLKTDEELYLVAAGSFAQTTENAPLMAVAWQLRFLITD